MASAGKGRSLRSHWTSRSVPGLVRKKVFYGQTDQSRRQVFSTWYFGLGPQKSKSLADTSHQADSRTKSIAKNLSEVVDKSQKDVGNNPFRSHFVKKNNVLRRQIRYGVSRQSPSLSQMMNLWFWGVPNTRDLADLSTTYFNMLKALALTDSSSSSDGIRVNGLWFVIGKLVFESNNTTPWEGDNPDEWNSANSNSWQNPNPDNWYQN